jgi:acyl dehydratase
MSLDQSFIGRSWPPTAPYLVGREKIREFAEVAGEHPFHVDPEAARAAGYADVIAPPTFAIVITAAGSAKVVADPDVGVNYAMVVHGEQSFAYDRPLRAGDVVVAQTTIESIRQIRSLTTMATVTKISTVGGEHVCTAHSTLVERGA